MVVWCRAGFRVVIKGKIRVGSSGFTSLTGSNSLTVAAVSHNNINDK